MLETLDQHFIKGYVAELRRALVVQGLRGERVDEVVREATAHLQDAMTATNPQSEADIGRVLTQFGSAGSMAKKLAAEELKLSKRRRFLWPTAFIPLAIYVSMHPLPQTRVFHGLLYIGTLYLLISAAVLFAMGIRARRPLVGQFVALMVGMIVFQVGWYAATSYPVAYDTGHRGVEWYEAIPRSGYDRELAQMDAGIARDREIMRQISNGKRVFIGTAAPKSVPPEFTYQGLYWLPEGVRELGLRIKPEEISKGLLTPSWNAAVDAYNGPVEGRGTIEHPWAGDAARLLRQVPEEIAMEQRALDYLRWIHAQPLGVQLAADYQMVLKRTVLMVVLGALCSNAGWLAWLLARMLGRVRRRILYRGDGREGVRLAG